jgi:AIPR protein
MPTQVRHVRDALQREFSDLIDLSDYQSRQPSEREQAFLSRSLAALIVRNRTGIDSMAAAATVIDGYGDNGIDAVAVNAGIPQLWLVQAKWSDQGRASLSVAEALKLVEGLTFIDQQRFDRFNSKLQQYAEQIKAVLRNPQMKITLVLALMGTHRLSPDVARRLEDAQADFNGYGPILDYEVCSIKEIWQIVRGDVAEPSIGLTVKMEQWIRLPEPFEAYYGTVAVGDIAQWHMDHGDRLFTQNIRKSLGLTQGNQSLVSTLTQNAENFWYFNNGITVLCDAIRPQFWSRSSRGPVALHLEAASVVNGAQTVAAIHQATQRDPEASSTGYVGVRVISVAGSPKGFAGEITKATNTQNRVERRDFVALDAVQSAIRDDLALSLQKAYVVKRGEMDPPPEAGCSVVHAATALACAYISPDLVARARRDPDLLWELGEEGAYTLLFGRKGPSAYRIWRSVLLRRAVGTALHDSQDKREGRAAAIAEHGELLITHLIFQYGGVVGIDDPDYEWEEFLKNIPELTAVVLGWVIHHVDNAFGPSSFISNTFGNPGRCRILAERVLSDLRVGNAVPELPTEYRPVVPIRRLRAPKAVATLVDAARIPDGTMLTFHVASVRERVALATWLAEDARRSEATWVNERSRPLLWAADGKRYSPSGLVQHMWKLARWDAAPPSVQGPARWSVPGEGSLVQLAASMVSEAETERREFYEEGVDDRTIP